MATTVETELDTFSITQQPILSNASPTTSIPAWMTLPTGTEQNDLASANVATTTTLPKGRSIIVIAQLSSVNLITSFTNGLLTVALPAIAADLALKSSLQVWPISVYNLTSGTCLLVAGAVADVLGPRSICLAGCLFLGCFMLASGLSRTGIELIMFRAMQGVASALVVPSSISIVSTSVENGNLGTSGLRALG